MHSSLQVSLCLHVQQAIASSCLGVPGIMEVETDKIPKFSFSRPFLMLLIKVFPTDVIPHLIVVVGFECS
jgi:hypothetical protein